MARPLRIDIRDGWYHVMSRGTERREIFSEIADLTLAELGAAAGGLSAAAAGVRRVE